MAILSILYVAGALIFVLSFIVFVHELGHYTVAKLLGVKVTDFSIGFGSKLFSIKDRSGTEWKFCWIPLGGYVKFLGDTDVASTKQTPTQEEGTFASKSVFSRSAIAVAGPAANFLLAIVILTSFFYIYGRITSTTEIGSVVKNSPAERNDLKVGDVILSIDGEAVSDFSDIERYTMSHPNIPLLFEIQRHGDKIAKTMTPEKFIQRDGAGNEVTIGKLGIGSSKVIHKKYNLFESTYIAGQETVKICSLTLKALGQIVTGKRDAKDIGGIIRITKYTAASVKQGFIATLSFIALFSINLGLINLLPIPPLDGGHLLLYVSESILSKRAHSFVRDYTVKVGFAFLIALMIFAVINDIINF